MAYQVLARKWRPGNFTQLVGQEHVSQSLIHAIQHNRLHHAYLFTGTRGVGKTTVARILAKAINCMHLQDFNPCGKCEVCQDFEQGRFIDMIEVDAASRTKVEDTRDLLDNVQYAPQQGRYKVYLIDEVHMLSGHSFNALLKTLEEPPPHVVFLLATTDPHKIPVTVLSRCLQYNLKRLLPEQISTQMQFILGEEGIDFELSALQLLAYAADGSLRDALSLLDQAIVHGGGAVSLSAVTGMLGTVAQQPIQEILQNLASGNAKALMEKIAETAQLTPDFADILRQILQILHRVAITQQLPDFVDHQFDPQLIASLAKDLLPEDIQLFYQIGMIGLRDLSFAPDPRSGFEMVMLRMLTFRPTSPASNFSSPPKHSLTKQVLPAKAHTSPPVETMPLQDTKPETQTSTSSNWTDIIAALNLNGRSRELVNNCVLDNIDEKYCHLLLDPSYKQIGTKAEDKLREALQNHFGRPLQLVITQQTTSQATPAVEMQKSLEDKQQAALEIINTDSNILALKESFSARIISGSIEPLN